MMDDTKKSLEKLGINEVGSDFVSSKRFEDGGQFRFEVPGIQGPSALDLCFQHVMILIWKFKGLPRQRG